MTIHRANLLQQESPTPDRSRLIDEERDRAERKVNLVRSVVLVVLAIAATAYAPVLPRALNLVNAALLVPLLAWTMGQAWCYYQRPVLPPWISIVNPIVDIAAVTATMAGYGLQATPALALKSPMVLAYFAILAARPMLSSARRAAIIAVAIVVAYAALCWLFVAALGAPIGDPVSASASSNVSLLDEAAKLLLLAAAGGIATYATWWHEQLARRYALQAEEQTVLQTRLVSSRLDSLQQQLRPHFLFNALNAITALVDSEPKAAQRLIARLADLIRVSLDTGGAEEIPLHDELRILDNYTAIQRTRFPDRLLFRADIDEGLNDTLVPTLILQPLIENAIQHGLGQRNGLTSVHLTAWRDGDSVALEILDDGPGLNGRPIHTMGERIGIGNARARLKYLYGSNQSFEIESPMSGGFRVKLRIPFHVSTTRELKTCPIRA